MHQPMDVDRIEKEIWFQAKFVDSLRSGAKRGTLRMGRRIPVSMSLPVVVTESHQRIGIAEIESLAWVRWEDVEQYPEILRREYPTGEALRTEMQAIYPALKSDSWLTFYGFSFREVAHDC